MNAGLTCDELRPLLGGYVLEALEPDEAEAVRQHLPGCPGCTAELASLADLPHLLDLAAPVAHPDEPLSPSFEEALLDRVARESDRPRPPRPRRRLPRIGIAWTRPRVAVVSAVLAAALAVGVMSLTGEGEQPQRASKNYIVALKPGPAAPGAKAHIAVYRVGNGTGVHLWASGLQPGSMKVYEMLCESKRWSASAGTFRADAHGKVEVRLTTAARVGEYDRVRVVTKDRDGTTSDVLTGRLF
jgi:anti-sigma factor RsiW